MTSEEIIKKTVAFVLSHYEAGPLPFEITEVDPAAWWQDMQLVGKVPEALLPRSRSHFEARLHRWQELATSSLSPQSARQFKLGERVRKVKGASWQGHVVGFYSTELTPIGYAVESEREPGSVQIYPEAALASEPTE